MAGIEPAILRELILGCVDYGVGDPSPCELTREKTLFRINDPRAPRVATQKRRAATPETLKVAVATP